jgi:hypothetical protein
VNTSASAIGGEEITGSSLDQGAFGRCWRQVRIRHAGKVGVKQPAAEIVRQAFIRLRAIGPAADLTSPGDRMAARKFTRS